MTILDKINQLKEIGQRAYPGDWDNRCREFSNSAKARHIWSEYGWLAEVDGHNPEPNAKFIVEARNNWDRLLQVIELQTEALEELQLGHTHSSDNPDYRPLSDSRGWCSACSNKVGLNEDIAREALERAEKIMGEE